MKNGLFHFKRFSVSHARSSMKIGVDGVLIGAWATPDGGKILDAGTGCGVIALMLAQRNPDCEVLAIDIDMPSIAEAKDNFSNSPWGERLEALKISYDEMCASENMSFDLIVSNPPFYLSGVSDFSTARNIARHQGDFSPEALILNAPGILNEGGRVAMIVPSEFFHGLQVTGIRSGLCLQRSVFVKDHPSAPVKRVMMEFLKSEKNKGERVYTPDEIPVLTMFDEKGIPTPEYRELGKDFYLKF